MFELLKCDQLDILLIIFWCDDDEADDIDMIKELRLDEGGDDEDELLIKLIP